MTSTENPLVAPCLAGGLTDNSLAASVYKNVMKSSIKLQQKMFEDELYIIKNNYNFEPKSPFDEMIIQFIVSCIKVAYNINKTNKIKDYQKDSIVKILSEIFTASSVFTANTPAANIKTAETVLNLFINDSYELTKIKELKPIYKFLKFIKRQFIK